MTGAAISSAILPAPKSQVSQTALGLCGVNDCPWNNATSNPNEKPPDSKTVGTTSTSCVFSKILPDQRNNYLPIYRLYANLTPPNTISCSLTLLEH